MDDFEDLIKKHLAGVASKEERSELMRIIKRGDYDKQIADRFSEEIEDLMRQPVSPEGNLFFERMYQDHVQQRQHEEPVVTKRLSKRRWLIPAAVAATVGVFAIASIWFVTVRKEKALVIAQQEQSTTIAGPDYVTLPDGSTVTMNKNSVLTYRESYGEQLREVELKGEAYFKVKPDKLHAFVVRVGDVQTYVLGTEFNVNAFNKAEVVVTVSTGKVQVLDNMQEVGVITPDQQLTVNTATHLATKADVKADKFLTWKSKHLIMYDVTLEEAARLIEEKFNVKVTLAENLRNCPVRSAFMNDESLSQVLEVITEVTGTICKTRNDHVVLTGKGCGE